MSGGLTCDEIKKAINESQKQQSKEIDLYFGKDKGNEGRMTW
jgi:hypothetical protein